MSGDKHRNKANLLQKLSTEYVKQNNKMEDYGASLIGTGQYHEPLHPAVIKGLGNYSLDFW